MFWSSKNDINTCYSYSSSPTFTSEPWSIHTGKPKITTTNGPSKVSIFIFDKKRFENYLLKYGIIKSKSSSKDKQLIHDAYNILRNQVNNLAKFKHPNILTLIEPIEEHSKNFIFVTEYVTASLQSSFQDCNNENFNYLNDNSRDIIIKRGILQVLQGLDFIHNRLSSVHLDLQPKSIFINESSDWKISGFGHLLKLSNSVNTENYYITQYDPRIPEFMQLDLNYTSPEIVIDHILSVKNDYFSLGILIYFLYYGKTLFTCEGSSEYYRDEYSKFEKRVAKMSWNNIFQKIPSKLRFCLPKLMNRDIFSRYDNITDLIESDFFQDPMIKTLIFLDDLPTKSNEERIIFLNGLNDLLLKFPVSLLQKKFLPVLLDLLDQICLSPALDSSLIGINLEIVIQIGLSLSQLSFNEKITPYLISKKLFKILLENATLCLIKNLEILQEKLKPQVFIDQILTPLLSYSLDLTIETSVLIQELLLKKIDIALNCFEFPTIKNYLFPLISQLFVRTVSLTVKMSCLAAFQLMIERSSIDKHTVIEKLFPIIGSMKTRDSRILISFLKLFKTLPDFIGDDELIIEQILPIMWNFSMSNTLSSAQYSQYKNTINNICSHIQQVHMAKLKQNERDQDMKGSQDFEKIIDKPVPLKVDEDDEASKKINVPAIQPQRNTRNFSSDVSPPIQQNLAQKSSLNLAKPLKINDAEITHSKFSLQTQKQSCNSNTEKSFRTTHSPGINMNNHISTTHDKDVTDKNLLKYVESNSNVLLPPGFSVTLQPNKRT